MDSQSISKQDIALNVFLMAIRTGIDAASDGLEKLNTRLELKAQQDAYKRALEVMNPGKSADELEINNENSVTYATKGMGYEMLSRELWQKNNIPCLAFTNSENNTVFICVPVQYQKAADDIVKSLNDRIGRTEVDIKRFELENKGDVGVYTGLSREQVEILRENLRGSGVGFCIQGTMDREQFRVMYPAESKNVMDTAITRTLARTMGVNGERENFRVNKLLKTAEKAQESIRDPKSTVYIADAMKPKSAMYRIDERGMHRIANGETTLVVKRESDRFLAEVKAKTLAMKAPMVKGIAKGNGSDERAEIYTLDEIRAAKEGMAISDAAGGKTALAEGLASQILELRVTAVNERNAGLANVLNSSASMSNVIANGKSEDCFREGVDELKDRYDKLGLSPEEDEHVVQFLAGVYGKLTDNTQIIEGEKEPEEKADDERKNDSPVRGRDDEGSSRGDEVMEDGDISERDEEDNGENEGLGSLLNDARFGDD